MSNYEARDIREILVTLSSGEQFIYRDKGILRIKKILAEHKDSTPTIIEDEGEDPNFPDLKDRGTSYSDLEGEKTVRSVKKASKAAAKKQKTKNVSSAGGYSSMSLSYDSGNTGRSPIDIARDLQKQAELAGNIRF